MKVSMGPVQRFTVHDEKKEFALKTDHDREDLIELPHFINFPSDQGNYKVTHFLMYCKNVEETVILCLLY